MKDCRARNLCFKCGKEDHKADACKNPIKGKSKDKKKVPTGRTKSLAWVGLGTRPRVPSGLVGLVGRALMPNVV